MPVREPRAKTPWDFIAKQRRELLRLDAMALREIRHAYNASTKKAWREFERVTRQIQRALENGEDVHPNWLWRQERWSALLIQLGQEMAIFGIRAKSTIDRLGTTTAYLGGEHAATRMTAVAPNVSFQMLPREALDMIVAQLRNQAPTGSLLADISLTAKRGLQTAMLQAMKDELTGGLAVGRNPRAIARSMYNSVKGQVDGLTLKRAERIARTESMRTYRAAQTENYRQNDDVVTGWIWIAALNIFTCAACLARHLTIHPLSEDMQSHVACRCTAMPMVDHERPDLPFGDEWLRDQPIEDQKEILGPGRWQLWHDGKITLADCLTETSHPTWGRSVNVTTLKRLRRIADGEEKSRPNPVWNPQNDPIARADLPPKFAFLARIFKRR